MIIPPIHVITPVWGTAYTRCFLEIGLASLLSPGNLPGLPATPRNVIHLFTTQQDLAQIEASPIWSRARETVDCRINVIGSDAVKVRDPHLMMSDCHRSAIEYADAAGAAMMFYNPDIVIADGGMQALVRLLEKGKRAIQVVGLRLLKEEVVPLLLERHLSPNGYSVVISPRELMAMAMPRLHPLTQMHMYGPQDFDLMPQELLWPVGLEGLVVRCFHIHPILVYPTVRNAPFSTTVDDDYLRTACPDHSDEYIVTDSDEFCLCELSSMQRDLVGVARTDDDRDIAEWAWEAARHHHLEHLSRTVYLHAGRTDTKAWRAAGAESDAAVQRIFDYFLTLEVSAQRRLPT
jgi:hypothetical protein